MDSLRNLPIYLCYEEGGTIVASCPLLPHCQCKARSRAQALFMMQDLIKIAFAARTHAVLQKGQRYEVIHLAVSASSDTSSHLSVRSSQLRKVEGPRLEVL